MLKSTIITGFAIVLLSCSGEVSHDDQVPSAGNTEAEILAAVTDYFDAINRGDLDKATDMYDERDGFHWIEQGKIQYENTEQAAQSLRDFAGSGLRPEIALGASRIAILTDNSAFASVQFSLTAYSADNAPQFAFRGWMSVAMVKREGEWRIAAGQTGPDEEE
jgi:ketosteroid isomerase-like protein